MEELAAKLWRTALARMCARGQPSSRLRARILRGRRMRRNGHSGAATHGADVGHIVDDAGSRARALHPSPSWLIRSLHRSWRRRTHPLLRGESRHIPGPHHTTSPSGNTSRTSSTRRPSARSSGRRNRRRNPRADLWGNRPSLRLRRHHHRHSPSPGNKYRHPYTGSRVGNSSQIRTGSD